MTTNTYPKNLQMIAGHNVSVRCRPDPKVPEAPATRFVRVYSSPSRGYEVPLQLLPLMAGKDAWMRKIEVKCSCCRSINLAGDMVAGGWDLICDDCQAKAEAEMALENMEEADGQMGDINP